MQGLLDEGDALFFAGHPGETERTRFYFRGERIDGGGSPSRYVRVTMEAGRLIRRFTDEGRIA